MNTSAHDLENFDKCLRAYDYTSWNRRRLQKQGKPVPALMKGTAFHLAMHSQRIGHNWENAVAQYLSDERSKYVQTYFKQVGLPPADEEMEAFDKDATETMGIVRNYFGYYGFVNPLARERLEYIKAAEGFPEASELNFRVAIPGTDGLYIGTIDGLARDPKNGDVYVVDHKTYSRTPSFEDVRMSYQFMGYVWAAKKLFPDLKIAGVLYDGVMSKEPERPKLLKSGKMSVAWIDTTEAVYREALEEHNLFPEDYEDILRRLRARDNSEESPFFTRWILRYPDKTIEKFEQQLIARYRRMVDPLLVIYPNFTWGSCRFCRVKDLCHAEQLDEDVDALIAQSYTVMAGSYHPETQAIYDRAALEAMET